MIVRTPTRRGSETWPVANADTCAWFAASDVEEITDSVLYLRYVLGEVDWNDLDRSPEKHIRCDPVLAQFIVSDSFEPV